jgi:hypothetical protein
MMSPEPRVFEEDAAARWTSGGVDVLGWWEEISCLTLALISYVRD